MTTINPTLHQTLTKQPETTFNLIIRTADDVTPRLNWLRERKITVRRQFRMSPGAAVSCCGADALTLIEQTWVVSVEADEAVSAAD